MLQKGMCGAPRYTQYLSNTRNISGPIHVGAENKDWVTHVLPTGRVVSPVGLVNDFPNFVTQIVRWAIMSPPWPTARRERRPSPSMISRS